MKFGLYISTQWPEGANISSEMDNMLEQVRVARDNGFSSVWMGQHYLVAPMQMMQVMPLLSRLAAEGEGMKFGTAVILLSMLNPAVVAEEAATLDWITEGNFVLGVGMGYRKEEFETLGVPFNQRVGRLEEGIDVIRRLWTEDRVNHDGKYFKIDNLGISLKPKRSGGPPIWLGGQVPAAVARAAQLGDAWMAAPTDSFGRVAKCVEMFRTARAEAGLPMPDSMPITRECCIRDTQAQALEVCRPALLDKYKALYLSSKAGRQTSSACAWVSRIQHSRVIGMLSGIGNPASARAVRNISTHLATRPKLSVGAAIQASPSWAARATAAGT